MTALVLPRPSPASPPRCVPVARAGIPAEPQGFEAGLRPLPPLGALVAGVVVLAILTAGSALAVVA